MKFATKSAAYVVIALAAFLVIGVPSVQAQHGSEGTVTVTVLDPSGSVVQGADLELRDVSTNNIRRAATQDQGVHTFPNLSLGKYSLTVKKAGFQSQEFTDVIVVIANSHAHPEKSFGSDSSFGRDVGEGAVAIVVVKSAAQRLLRSVHAGGGAIDQVQVEQTVLVVVDPAAAGAHGFDQILLRRSRVVVAEVNARLCRDVREGDGAPVLWEGTGGGGERQREIAHLLE